MTVTSVEVAVDAALSRTEVLRLVPELQKETVNVQRLSRQLALYNEGYLVNVGSSGGEAHIQVAGGAVTQQHSAGKRQTGSIYAYDESDITLKGTESITFDGASQGFSDGSHVRADGKITFAAPIIKIKLPTEIAGGEVAGLDADKTSIAAGAAGDCDVRLWRAGSGRGLGVFYWEPDWYAVDGVGWKTGAGNNWAKTPFTFNVYQELTDLPDGVYAAEVATQGKGDAKSFNLYVIGDNGEKKTAAIQDSGWKNWRTVRIDGITIKGGKATVGIEQQGNGDNWGSIDNVKFYRKS